jgi:hypothetical protein
VLAKHKQTHKKIESLGNSFRFHAIGVLLFLLLEVAASSFLYFGVQTSPKWLSPWIAE